MALNNTDELLKELENELKNRYTDLDEDFSRVVDEKFISPPVVKLPNRRQPYYNNNHNNNGGRNYHTNQQHQYNHGRTNSYKSESDQSNRHNNRYNPYGNPRNGRNDRNDYQRNRQHSYHNEQRK